MIELILMAALVTFISVLAAIYVSIWVAGHLDKIPDVRDADGPPYAPWIYERRSGEDRRTKRDSRYVKEFGSTYHWYCTRGGKDRRVRAIA